MQATMPNSSAVTAKMKSVCASGRMRLTVPSPGPRPNQPPLAKLSSAVSTWKRVAGGLVQEALDALPHVRQQLVGGADAERGRSRRGPTTQNECRPATKKSPPQTMAISMVWPKSGCSISGTMVAGRSAIGEERARHVAPPRALREGPGGEDHEGGLHEFGRLQAEAGRTAIQRCAPLISGPKCSARRQSATPAA